MKYFIALLLAFLTFSCSDRDNCLQLNRLYKQEDIYSIEHKNGILFLKIDDFNINTHASVYSRYKIRSLSKEYIFLQSSDIGEYIITNKISKEWNTYLTKNIKVGDYDVFIISLKPFDSNSRERDSNGLLVLFVKEKNIGVFNLEGLFHFKFSPVEIKENSVSIRTKSNTYTFDISNRVSLRQDKK